MKRILLAAICILAMLLAGCTEINQNNSFIAIPTPETTSVPLVTATPADTLAPEATPAPQGGQPPVVLLEIEPTSAPGATDMPPMVTPTATPPAQNSPGGFNG